MRPARRALLAAAAPLLAPALARGQPGAAWSPSQPIRLVIPFTPGSAPDPIARLAQPALQELLGQPTVIDHRPGAATVVGTQELARSAPDGHTVFMASNILATNITLRPNTPYDALRDFAPLTRAAVSPHLLLVNPGVAAGFPEFLAVSRRPGAGVSFGSYGVGTSNHLGGEQFARAAGLNATHVPYPGNPQANNDLVAGRTQWMFGTLSDVLPFVQSGRMRALGVAAAARARELPEVPTMAELGFPEVIADSWFGVICRADVPAPARARLAEAWRAALNRPEVRGRLEELGMTVLAEDEARFGAEIRRYAGVYAEVIRAASIRVE